jgi:hypothetical protein
VVIGHHIFEVKMSKNEEAQEGLGNREQQKRFQREAQVVLLLYILTSKM